VTFDTFGQLSNSFVRLSNPRGNESSDLATRFNALCFGFESFTEDEPTSKAKALTQPVLNQAPTRLRALSSVKDQI
jgi:hypothetical protein